MRDNLFLFNYLLDEFLREIKKKFGISTKLLTVELGISKNMLNNWKKGTHSPNIKSIKKLLTYLNKFNKEQNEIIVKNPNISSLIKALLNMLYTEVDIYPETNNEERRKKWLQKERKENFKQSFNNYILFLNEINLSYKKECKKLPNDNVDDQLKYEIHEILITKGLINSDRKIGVQKILSQRLGVSCAQISRWKKGVDYPSKLNLDRIKKLMAKDPTYRVLTKEDFRNNYESSNKLMFINNFEINYIRRLEDIISSTKRLKDNFLNEFPNWQFLRPTIFERRQKAIETLYSENIMLLRTAYKVIKKTDDKFPEWLYNKIADEKLLKIHVGTMELPISSCKNYEYFSREIYDSFKDIRNFQNKLNSGDSLNTTVLNNCVLLVLAREFIIEVLLMKDRESFIEWFHENSYKFEVVENYAVKSINLADLFNKTKEEPLKEFFEQFRQLILDKQNGISIKDTSYEIDKDIDNYLFHLVDVLDLDNLIDELNPEFKNKYGFSLSDFIEAKDVFEYILKKNNIHKRNSEEIPFLESVRRDEQIIIEFFKIHPVLNHFIMNDLWYIKKCI